MKRAPFAIPRRAGTLAAFLTTAVMLGGCATFSKDGGFGTVSDIAEKRLGQQAAWLKTDEDRQAAADRTRKLLAKPLSMDDAIQVALINNPGLQASYGELGIAEADLVQTGRLPNPKFSFSRAHSPADLIIDRTFSVGILSVLTMPLSLQIQGRRFDEAKLLASNAMLKVAADARRAYVNAVAAQQSADYAAQVRESAEAAAQLAQRMRQVGNFSKLDYAREQAFYGDAVVQLARSRQEALVAREKLTRAMGLWGSAATYALPKHLPDLPQDRPSLPDLENFAMQNRLDIQAAKLETQGVASSLGLTKATRFVNALDVGYLNNFETDKGHEQGFEISVEVPLFDWGGARVARAQAIYMQSVSRIAQTAIDARSEVRASYAAYQTEYDVAKHYRDNVVPLHQAIFDEMQLRYNGMLASIFELLAESRQQVGAVNGYIGALRDYWLAETDLQQSLGGALPVAPAKAQGGAPQRSDTVRGDAPGAPVHEAAPAGLASEAAPALPASAGASTGSAHTARPADARGHEQKED